MNQSNLREVEKKTYMSYHKDGLIDIFIGLYISLLGLSILLLTISDFSTWFIIPAIFPAIISPVWISAKKKITMPRIGFVKFGTTGVNKLTMIFISLLVAGLGAFMLLSFASSQEWALSIRDLIIPNTMIILGISVAAVSSLFAYTMGLNRLYMYGLLSLTMFVLGFFINIPMAYIILFLGLIITANGFVLLRIFIKKYPIK